MKWYAIIQTDYFATLLHFVDIGNIAPHSRLELEYPNLLLKTFSTTVILNTTMNATTTTTKVTNSHIEYDNECDNNNNNNDKDIEIMI